MGPCQRGPREGRGHQGLHQVPHEGRYDRRRVRHRGVPARFADRREAHPRLRRIRRQDHGVQGCQDQPGVPQRGRFAQGPDRGRARGPEADHHVEAREGSDPRGYRQEHHLVRRIRRPGRRGRPDPHHRPLVGPREPSRGDRQARSEDPCRNPRLRRPEEAHRAGSEAAHPASVGGARSQPEGRRQGQGQGGRDGRLRRIRRDRPRRRGPDPRLVVEPAPAFGPGVPEGRRRGRGRHPDARP